jgi:L-asparagine transporter-like permease
MELRRQLTTSSLVILGTGGAIGSGILFSTAGTAALAGPAVVAAWIVGGIFSVSVFLPWGVASRLAQPIMTSQTGRVTQEGGNPAS